MEPLGTTFIVSCAITFILFDSLPRTAGQHVTAPSVDGGWRRGRASFYDAPDYFATAYAVRGEGSYGSIAYGSCGFFDTPRGAGTLTDANVPYPKGQVAALANIDPDYPGSCGRCYEVRCSPGLVIGNGSSPIRLDQGFNMAAINPNVEDTFGRSWPGNSAESQGEMNVVCWGSNTVVVRIIDTCPQYQDKDGVIVPQDLCNSDVNHFDLSFWAFEQLAHPVYGTQMLDFRPVSCLTRQPLNFLPGFVNQTIYENSIQTGWAWHPYEGYESVLNAPGGGVGGGNGTCIASGPNGGLTLKCRECNRTGYQPFSGASSITLAARADDTILENVDGTTATSVGSIPPLTLYLGLGADGQNCNNQVSLNSQTPTNTQPGGWFVFNVPLSVFGCSDLSQVTSFGVQNKNGQVARYCLDQIRIVGGGQA